MARPRRIRVICSGGPIWSIRAARIWPKSARGWRAKFRRRPRLFPGQRGAGRAGATTRPIPKAGIPPLAVYNPIHYQELPELFMDFICSLTGKSPSTTGFGSEGALTKGPFNALWPVVDVNNALVSAIVTGYGGFTTAAGHIGPHYRVDHDNSMLVPELWCRMRVYEREPQFLIDKGCWNAWKTSNTKAAECWPAGSGTGLRRCSSIVSWAAFSNFRARCFPEELLSPEKQDLGNYVAGIEAICEAQKTRGAELFRRRQRGCGVSADQGAAAHHGARALRRQGDGRSFHPQPCSHVKACSQAIGMLSD